MKSSLVTVLGGASTALAAVKGFNYAAQGQDQASFEASFRKAAGLQGANDFTGARLYTMIQEGTTNSPIEAIPAAIDTNTTMLLGLWASSPQNLFDNEIDALKTAIEQYGPDFHGLVTGISVGSEDLYRISATGIANDPDGVGQTPDTLIDYISQVRDALKGTPLEGTPVGHVDTWNAYVNGSNSKVIEACDFLGLDEYPYFQTTDPNAIENGQKLFFEAYDKVAAVAGGKPLWITEAGWPVSGKQSGEAIASVDNAEIFWQEVACALEKKNINFWWYILEENADPSFAVSSNGKPLYNLACNATSGTIPSGGSNSSSSSSNSTSSGGSSGHGQGSGSSSSTGSSSGSSGSSSGSGSQSSGSGASSTGSSATASSTFDGAADKAQVGIFGLMLTAVVAIFAL